METWREVSELTCKLKPARLHSISPFTAAIVGFVLGESSTELRQPIFCRDVATIAGQWGSSIGLLLTQGTFLLSNDTLTFVPALFDQKPHEGNHRYDHYKQNQADDHADQPPPVTGGQACENFEHDTHERNSYRAKLFSIPRTRPNGRVRGQSLFWKQQAYIARGRA